MRQVTKTKKEWIEWFNSLDDDVEITFDILHKVHEEDGKVKAIKIYRKIDWKM